MIYFDHNATSPLSDTARHEWLTATDRYLANPSSPHRLGARAEVALSTARQTAAAFLGCSEFELVWTSGATEANNSILASISRTSPGQEVWCSAIEHPSVFEPAAHWCGPLVKPLQVTEQGVLDLDCLRDRLGRTRPALVLVMAANNETGVLQPWRDALELCHAHGVPFACDAAQWIGKMPAAGLGKCDFLSMSAHKFGGPVGIGLMKVPAQFQPLLLGGPQEYARRAGTEPVASALAMLAAWTEREQQMSSGGIEERSRWRDDFIRALKAGLPGTEVLGERSGALWNTVAAIMPKTVDCRRRWVVQLDKLGFAVSTGSACSSGKEKPSHVLTALGFASEKSDRMLRFSSGWNTTEDDWRALLNALRTAAAELGA